MENLQGTKNIHQDFLNHIESELKSLNNVLRSRIKI